MKRIVLLVLLLFPIAISAQEQMNQFDSNGQRHGLWQKTYEDGQLRYSGTFKNGKEVGVFNYYSPKSPKYPTIVKNFKSDGTAQVFFYSEKGIPESEGAMSGKERIGKWVYYAKDGKTILSIENYVKGVLEGEVKTFYANGKPTEILNYRNGKIHGLVQRYSDEGVLLDEVNYENGKRNGAAKYYNTKGELIYSGMYKNDLKVGTWEYTKAGNRDGVTNK